MPFTNGEIPPVINKIVDSIKIEAENHKLHISDVEDIITKTRIDKEERDRVIKYLINSNIIKIRSQAVTIK